MTFSKRTDWNPPTNRLALARRRRGANILDLTPSNPTQAGLDYPNDELADIMARAARVPYTPDPLGLRSAREALAAELRCTPEDLLLTASTSEAYSFLFKLLCNPGDDVITTIPSYPLLESLSALELIALRSFALEFHARWEIDSCGVRNAVTDRTRAIVIVNPNNPTGSYVLADEQEALARFGMPIISDEVFLDYPLERSGSSFVHDDVLTFVLGGLSKSAGLPHYKLGWIRVTGAAAARREALAGLELIADNFLSVSTPVQAALPDLLRIAPRIRAAISERIRGNLGRLRAEAASAPAVRVLPVEGGWSAVIRIPITESDEEFALRLIEEQGVVIHPGYFFDFQSEGFFVVSLLTQPSTFEEGVRRLVHVVPSS